MRIRILGVALALVASFVSATEIVSATEREAKLRFVASDRDTTSLSLSAMLAACPAQSVAVVDPYHERTMRYFAMRLICVLDLGFASVGGSQALKTKSLLLRALDGYTRPVSGVDLVSPQAYLAFGEVALMGRADSEPRFSWIDRREVDPAPFYLVWSGSDENHLHELPWPYQLVTIEIASFRDAFPHTLPAGLDESDSGWVGYAIFKRSCAACHSINGEGGKVGPDLNIPRSIVEYRPIDQIKSYIRDPQATRYTSMPAHHHLSEADLDALIAYFEAMSKRKHDPGRSAARPSSGS